MATELTQEREFIEVLGMETYKRIYEHSMDMMKAFLNKHKPKDDAMNAGNMCDLLKLGYPEPVGVKWLFTEFCWEIDDPIEVDGKKLQKVTTWYRKAILFNDGENMDDYFDRYNQLKELAAKYADKITQETLTTFNQPENGNNGNETTDTGTDSTTANKV